MPARKPSWSSLRNAFDWAMKRSLRGLLLAFVVALLGFCVAGCTVKTILVDPKKDVMRLAKPVKCEVFVYGEGGRLEKGKVVLPAGYFVLYVSEEELKR